MVLIYLWEQFFLSKLQETMNSSAWYTELIEIPNRRLQYVHQITQIQGLGLYQKSEKQN